MGWRKREAAAAEQQRAMAASLAKAGRAASMAVREMNAGAAQVRSRGLAVALSQTGARPVVEVLAAGDGMDGDGTAGDAMVSDPVVSDPATLAVHGAAEDAERLALLLAAAQAAIRAIDEATQAVSAMQRIGRPVRPTPTQYAPAPQRAPASRNAPAQCAPLTSAFGLASNSTRGTARKNTPAMSSSTSL